MRTADHTDHPPEDAAASLASDFLKGDYSREAAERLSEMAVSEDSEVAAQATAAIFTSVVEPLADSFEPAAVSFYNRFFAQLVQHCRKAERGRVLDAELNGFGLTNESDLLDRVERLRRAPMVEATATGAEVRRVVVLSRVTLGADVAVTSVVLERMKRRHPSAEITLVGGRKAAELFGGDSRLSFREIDYGRAGTTVERLLSWIDVLGSIREMSEELGRGGLLIVDPDSRLTQLGLLPVARQADRYLFFPSREYGHDRSEPLGRLIGSWLDEISGEPDPILPRLSLRSEDRERAGSAVRLLRRGGERPVISINFGVGENPKKRIGGDFEQSLVSRLINDGARVILDKGAGEAETRRADEVIAHVRRGMGGSRLVVEVSEESLASVLRPGSIEADLLVWRGRIGLLAALIGETDLYIGYDSAGQHIASALGVRCIDIFAGFSSPRMLERWRPVGSDESRVIAVDTLGREPDGRAVLADVLRHSSAMLSSR